MVRTVSAKGGRSWSAIRMLGDDGCRDEDKRPAHGGLFRD